MRLLGVLPVSGFNLGLALYPQIVTSKIEDLIRFSGKLALSLPGQLAFQAKLPSLAATMPKFTMDYTMSLLALAKLPAAVAEAIATLANPAKWLKLNSSMSLSVGLELGLVTLAVEALAAIDAQLELGLRPPALRMWTFSGTAAGMADGATAIRCTTGRMTNALVIATESPSTWGQLGKSIYTGSTANGYWRNNGTLSAADLLPGIVRIKFELFRFLLKLRGMQAKLQAQLEFALGITLPKILIDPGLALKLAVALDPLKIALDLQKLLTLRLDLQAQIELLQVKINALLELMLDIQTQLSAGGLVVWVFNGQGQDLPGEISAAVRGGIPAGTGPGARVYALCVACEDAEAWGNLGNVLAVA